MFIFYAAIVSAMLFTIGGIFCLFLGPVMICH